MTELTWQNADASAKQMDLPVSGPGDVWRRVCLDVTQQRHHVALNHANFLFFAANYSRRHCRKMQWLCCSKKNILYITTSDYMGS